MENELWVIRSDLTVNYFNGNNWTKEISEAERYLSKHEALTDLNKSTYKGFSISVVLFDFGVVPPVELKASRHDTENSIYDDYDRAMGCL